MSLRLRFHNEGFRELRTAERVLKDLERRAAAVAAAAGPGVSVLPVQEPRNRARVLVGPVTSEAAGRVAQDNSLVKALVQEGPK